jgi:hypothetical protein
MYIQVLRVMPSDNSCLFTAFGGALPEQIPAQRLRRMMADYIEEHRDVYSEAILGSKPEQYCRSIQDPDRWGGGIELSILSTIFNIQICTYDVQVRYHIVRIRLYCLILKHSHCIRLKILSTSVNQNAIGAS